MASPDEKGVKGNRKGRGTKPVWAYVKNASLAASTIVFVLTIVLALDAYKFVSVKHAKFARRKLLRTLQYMDPSIIEAHTGMKVLTRDEFDDLHIDLEKARKEYRQLNLLEKKKVDEVRKSSDELRAAKRDYEELTKLIATKDKVEDELKAFAKS